MADTEESSGAPEADDASRRIDQIADAALRLFARYGYKRSSMDDIAREAGLSKATLYLHFKGKDDVFRAMLNLLTRRIDARCREVMTLKAPFAERFAAMLQAQHGVAYACFGSGDHLVELKCVMASIAGPELQAIERLFADHFKRLLTDASSAGEIDLAKSGVDVDAFIASLMFAAAGAKVGDPPSMEAYADRLSNVANIFASAIAR